MKKKSIFKMLSLGFASIFVGGAVLSVSAAPSKDVLKLSKSQAVALSMKNSNDMKRLDTGLKTLDRKFKNYKELSRETSKAKEDFEDYKEAYKKINSDEFKMTKSLLHSFSTYSSSIEQIEKLKVELEQAKKAGDAEKIASIGQKLSEKVKTYDNVRKKILTDVSKKEVQEILSSANMSIDPSMINILKLDIESLVALPPSDKTKLKGFMDIVSKENKKIEDKLAEFNAGKVKLAAMGLANPATGEPKHLTSKEEYNLFIMPRDIPWYSVQCMIQKTVKKKALAKYTIDVKVKEAYDSLLYAKEGYALKKQLYDRMVKGYNDTVKSCSVGKSSKLEEKITKIELDKTKIELDKLSRDIENGEIQFKNALGISLTQEIELTDTLNKSIKAPLSYEKYLNDAMSSRCEIFDCKMDLEEKKRTFDILKDYFDDEDYEWLSADKEVDDADIALDEATKNVKENIQNAYLDVTQKKREIDLAHQNMEQAKTKLDSATKAYEAGVKTVSLTLDATLGVNKAQMDYNTATRNYNIALYKLEMASKLGPKY